MEYVAFAEPVPALLVAPAVRAVRGAVACAPTLRSNWSPVCEPPKFAPPFELSVPNVYDAMPDCASLAEAVTVKAPPAEGRMYRVELPSQYAFAETPVNVSDGVDGAVVSILTTLLPPEVPWLPTWSLSFSRYW